VWVVGGCPGQRGRVEKVAKHKVNTGDRVIISVEGVVTAITDKLATLNCGDGNGTYVVPTTGDKVNVVVVERKKEPIPEPGWPNAMVRLIDAKRIDRLAAKRPSGRWLLTGSTFGYAWDELVKLFGNEVYTITGSGLYSYHRDKWSTVTEKKPAPVAECTVDTNPFAWMDEGESIHLRDARCPSLYHYAYDSDETFDRTNLEKRVGPVKALRLDGDQL